MNDLALADNPEALAIIGMACRLPGAPDTAAFWRNLCDARESITFFTNTELEYTPSQSGLRHHPHYVKAGAILEDIALFDAAFFGITPREAELIDPQQRLFLECAWEALDSAGYTAETSRVSTGVYAGASSNTYFLANLYARQELLAAVGSYNLSIANRGDFLATRVSYKLNLKGPSLTIQTACSTSLVAVHLACQSLLNGECDMALAGGVSISVPQKAGYLYQEGGILSPDGHCRAFDARAQGTVGGSGVGVVVLKRLSEAHRDGDHIWAVIKGSAVNNDGAVKAGFTAPGVDGQAAVIAEALAVAGVHPETMTYIEAHGTGTALGDPLEIKALTQAFRARTARVGFCALGSVKTNIGHLDTAAGIAGLIKTVLALYHKMLPASLHFEQPNPQIDFAHSPFYVNTRLSDWQPEGLPRRAGVSSFGIGGTNAHVVLEEASGLATVASARPWHLLVLSTHTDAALARATTRLSTYLQQHPEVPLADVAYTLQVGRKAFRQRCMVVCQSHEEAVTALKHQEPQRVFIRTAATREWPVVFLFPGQGTQYVNMALELYRHEVVFREQVEHCATLLLPHLGCDIRQVLYPSASQAALAAQQLLQTQFTQPALFVIEYALAQLWIAWGIRPQAMLGHSLGEYVAACLAGVFSLQDALALVATRGRLMQQLPGGAMLAVALPEQEVQPLLDAEIALAAHNGPALCVVSGPAPALASLEQRLTQRGVATRRVQTSHAFHSAMMESILEPFRAAVRQVTLQAPRIPYVSNVTGAWITAAEATDVDYWPRHMRQPVRFAAGLHALLQDPDRILLEVGPGQTLSTFAQQHPDKAAEQVVLASLPRTQDADMACLFHTLGQLWLAGMPVQWSNLYTGERRQRRPLPTYPFERTYYWVAPAGGRRGPEGTTREDHTTMLRHDTHEPSRRQMAASRPLEPPQLATEEKDTRMLEAPLAVTPRVTRQAQILSALKAIAHDVSGIDPAAIDASTTFLAMGVHSLLLIQFSQAMHDTLGVEVPFRLLFEELSTLDALSSYLDRELPSPALPAERLPSAPEHTPPQSQALLQASDIAAPEAYGAETWNGAEPPAPARTTLERIMAQQLHVMSQQLEVLRGQHVGDPRRSATATPPPASLSPPTALALEVSPRPPANGPGMTKVLSGSPPTAPETRDAVRLGPFKATQRDAMDSFSAQQQAHLQAFIARYSRRVQESKRLTQTFRPFLADTRAIVGFRLPWKELVCPIIAPRAIGARVWDVDGNEYIDLTMGFGVNLFGHSPAFITAALEEQIRHGIHLGPQSPLAGQAAQLVAELTGMERVTFCNTGSEAVMTALRLARTATRRSRFAVFAGSYHGNFDEVLFRAQPRHGTLQAVPVAPGIPAHLLKDVLVLEYARPESLALLKAQAHDLAAVLVEPVQSSRLDVQPTAFLHELRQVTAAAGTALIFDEMITGFRMHPGGAQAWFGVQADLATYGKVIGGGMPLGVVAGKAAYMDAIDGGMWHYGDTSYPQAALTFFAGTFCKHPLAMAAALATLNHLKDQGPELQQRLNQRTARVVETLQTSMAQAQAPIRIEHFGSMFRFVFEPGVSYPDLFYFHLLEKGIHLWEGRACFLSTAHTDTDVAEVVRIVQASVAEMQDGGFLPASSTAGAKSSQRAAASPAAVTPTAESTTPAVCTVPLTEGQKDIWMLSQLGDDASRASNLATVLRLRGPFNAIAMQQALQALVQRHEACRTTFSPDGECQVIHPTMDLACPLVDLSNVAQATCEAQIAHWIRGQTRQVFDLVRGPLLRVQMARVTADMHLLTFIMHHIILDGRSFGLFMKECKALYAAACQGIPPQLAQPGRFSTYALQQVQQQHAAETRAAEAYWLRQFHDCVPLLVLPTDHQRPTVQTYAGARQEMWLAPALQPALSRLGTQHGCSLFMLLLATFQALLHRLTGQDDIVVGIAAVEPVATSATPLLGYTTSVLPLRSRVDDFLTFTDYLSTVKQTVFDAYTHQSYSLNRLIEKLHLQPEPSQPPLVSTVFNLDYAGTAPALYGLEVEMSVPSSGAVECDMFWNITATDTGLLVECYYNTDLFESETMQRWLGYYQAMLVALVSAPSQRLRHVHW